MRAGDVRFDPNKPIFRAHHRIFRALLPFNRRATFLEIGAHPGQYLWYFNAHFGFAVTGIEYVEEYARQTASNLEASGVTASIEHADLFQYCRRTRQFDVVASFGFVEHFVDIQPAIDAHWALVKPGGTLIVSVPNHSGVLGRLFARIDPHAAARHNRMDLTTLQHAVARAPDAEVVTCRHIGSVGFWNSGLYTMLRARWRRAYWLCAAPFKFVEYLGPLLPDSRQLSPNLLAIVRKRAITTADAGSTGT